MKTKSILALILAIGMLVSCNKEENGSDLNPIPDVDVAYVSIAIQQQASTRSSDERQELTESDLKSLYIATFDNLGNIVGIPGTTTTFFADVPIVAPVPPATTGSNPEPIKVSAKATQLLVVANPGTLVQGVFASLGSHSSFTTLNQAITNATMAELTDDTSNITKGFTMINSGQEKDANGTLLVGVGDKITNPLIDLTGKIKEVSGYPSEADAIDAAKTDRAEVKIERLSAKLELKVKSPLTYPTNDAEFTFDKWTLDAVNSTFYPFAEKTILAVNHITVGGDYNFNFYTQDPNFTDKTGLKYTEFDNLYNPTPPHAWLDKDAKTYCIENTMAAAEQRFENATRLVIKGKYYPDKAWTGDWFSFAGIHYKDLDALQAAYNVAGATNLQAACDDMFTKLETFANAHTILTFTATDFASLTEDDLKDISNGGDVIKTDKNTPCIRWYQKGLSYYYYVIHHDYTGGDMEFGKYGVVRNNWYSLTIAEVKGPGSPWYPDINNPGPGDPDPKDPIDDSVGYLGVQIEVEPWIIWEREIII